MRRALSFPLLRISLWFFSPWIHERIHLSCIFREFPTKRYFMEQTEVPKNYCNHLGGGSIRWNWNMFCKSENGDVSVTGSCTNGWIYASLSVSFHHCRSLSPTSRLHCCEGNPFWCTPSSTNACIFSWRIPLSSYGVAPVLVLHPAQDPELWSSVVSMAGADLG
jgi:hypothetical protein